MYLEGNRRNCHFFPVSLYVKLFQFETFRHITCLLFVEILCFFAIALYRAAESLNIWSNCSETLSLISLI